VNAEFPRLLVVTSNNFNLIGGGGITLTNLFRGWPADRLANLHEDSTPEDHSVCQNFYRLSDDEIRWRWPFSLARGWYGRMKEHNTPPMKDCFSGTEMPAGRWLGMIRRGLGEGVPKYARLTDRLRTWLEDFRPGLLYAFLGSLEQIHLTRLLVERFQVPLVVHMMDDWPAVLYQRGWLAPIVGPVLRREVRYVLARAAGRLAICEAMGREYEARYGYKFLAFQNAIDSERWLPYSRTNWKAGTPFLIRYVGSIVPDGQRESLKDMARAVTDLAADGIAVRLQIHAPRHESSYLHACGFPEDAVYIEGPPDPAAIARFLAEADLLLLPYNFDPRSARYIRLSLPTKAPAYMMSGTPILVYAPPDVATADYASREGWGYVVPSRGTTGLKAAVKLLMGDESLRESLGRRARLVAQANHDAAKVRPAFWQVLCAVAERNPTDRRVGEERDV
jgi:glycosyltransferase involved in cell wall biosynthesis